MHPNHAEVAAALKKALAAYPNLTPNGFDETNRPFAGDYPFSCIEVATALAFLKQCQPAQRATYTSYELKHMAEDWGQANGLAGFVSNGALIVAAVALDFPIRRKGLDLWRLERGIAVSGSDIAKVMKSFKNSWGL
jgi:hypothetical protein